MAALLLFAVSGMSGLVHQVIWVRQVSLAFGSTVQSAALVTSTFLGALGLGALLAGRWTRTRAAAQAQRGYALVELAIAVLGLALAFALPWLGQGGGVWLGYVSDENGWQVVGPGTVAGRVLVVVALLGPPSALMGATLPLWMRAVVDARQAGFWVGLLYGANTLGAAVGAVATDLALVPALGLRGTLAVACALNLIAAGGAILLPAAGQGADANADGAEPMAAGPVAVALFLAGFAAMGLELAWLRFLGGALGPYRSVFSILVAVLLGGQVLGAVLAGVLARRLGRPDLLFALAQATVATLALGGFARFDPEDIVRRQLALIPDLASGADPGLASHGVSALTALWLVGPAAVAMGAAFPLGNAMAQSAAKTLGSRGGALYLATTAGNMLGALLVGFVWLPGLGLQGSVMLLGALAVAAPLALGRRGAPALAGLVAVLAFAGLPAQHLLWASFPANRVAREGVLAVHEGVEQIVVVTGRAEGPARLWTGGHPMTSTTPHAQRYMRLMAHVPLLMQEAPERVGVICFGVGNTLSAAALHPSVTELHAIDLSRDVLSHATYFEHANGGVLRDPRLTVFVNDGRHHLLAMDVGYDVLTLEPPPIGHAGIASLYSVGFYEAARERLREGGVISQWLPAYQLPEPVVESLVAAFVEVFPDAALLVGSGRELVLVGSRGATFTLAAVDRRIGERPQVAADLARIGAPDARQLALGFAGTPEARGPALTDDWPWSEYVQGSHVMETRLPSHLFEPLAVGEWCVDCADDPGLVEALGIVAPVYASESWLRFSNLVDPRTTASVRWDLEPEERLIVEENPALAAFFGLP